MWINGKSLREFCRGYRKIIDDERIIGEKSFTDLYTWIDAAYVVHIDMRSHTGIAISMGHGVFHEKASVQRLNPKIPHRRTWLV